MMAELGKYAAEVMSAYAVSLILLGGICWVSLRRARHIRAALAEVESRVRGNG